MLVVDFPLLMVTQYSVGCVYLFEYFCCLSVPWILVWVILQGQSPTKAISRRGVEREQGVAGEGGLG